MINTLKNFLFITVLSFCALSMGEYPSLQGATIHALLVGDTLDDTIGNDCNLDLQNMEMMIHDVARKTGMNPIVTVVKEELATTENILNFLNTLSVESDDVLFIYFSMHGYRTPSKTNPWPNLYFGQDNTGIDFDYIAGFGKEKKARLLISIADVCNNQINDGIINTIKRRGLKSMTRPSNEQIANNYKRLFLHSSGTITLAGSMPGEYSWSITGKGGAYSLGLLSTLKDVTTNSHAATWDMVLSRTSITVLNATKSIGSQGGQHPQQSSSLN